MKDILQLLKEKSEKMERLGLALKVIQNGMRQNTQTTIKTGIGGAAEVLESLLNTHKCLLKSGVKIQKRLESHPASKKMGISRRHRSASLGNTPKMQSEGEEREAPSPTPARLGDAIDEGRPVLRRHLEGNEGEGQPLEGRTRGLVYPEDQEGGSPPGPQKGGGAFRPSARSSTRRSGRGQKFRPWYRRGFSKVGTLTRPLRKERSCLSCAWH